jgi:hypothetical protein
VKDESRAGEVNPDVNGKGKGKSLSLKVQMHKHRW